MGLSVGIFVRPCCSKLSKLLWDGVAEEALRSKMEHGLAILRKKQGKLAESEKMYIWALKGYEEALGSDHTSTLLTVNNLGNLYADQGKLAEAEKMYTRALKGREALGLDHKSILDCIHCLAILCEDQGKLAESEKMYVQALKGYEEALGLNHISTLDTLINLGNLYAKQGKLAEAEKMYTRALSGYATVQGPSSKLCTEIQSRLQALQPVPVESEAREDRITETRAQESRPLKRKFSAGKGGR